MAMPIGVIAIELATGFKSYCCGRLGVSGYDLKTLILAGKVFALRGGQMRNRLKAEWIAGAGIFLAVFWLGTPPTMGQVQSYKAAARTADGKPDLNGIWQAINTANWDIQDHAARMGPVAGLGAAFSVPAGRGVVEGNDI